MQFRLSSIAIIFAVIIGFTGLARSDGHKVWELETKGDVESKYFLQNGKYFFVRAEEYLHCFDGENGKEIWKTEIPDYEKLGFKYLWNEKEYIVSTENEELISYDVYTGKVLWKQKYVDIDQDDNTSFDDSETAFLIMYGKTTLCIDPVTGKELWRHKIRYDANRNEKGLANYFDVTEGDAKRILFATEDGLLLLDAANGATLWENPDGELSDEENVKAVSYFGSKALLMYDDDQISFLDVLNGKELWKRKQEIGDIEGYKTIGNANGVDYLLISLDDTQLMINLTTGKVAWETKPGEMEGLLTHYKEMDGGKSLCYFKRKLKSGKDKGTHLDLYLIETATGKVSWKQEIAMTEWAPAIGFANFLSKTLLGTKVFQENDYGFIFTEYEVDNDIVFLIRGTTGASDMVDPTKRDGDGEGIVRINLTTGKITYRSYFPLNKIGFRWSAVKFEIKDAPQPVALNGNIFVVGAERVVCADLKTGTIVWKIDDDLGFPVDWLFFDNTIFLKVGKQGWDIAVNAKSASVDAKKAWNKDPYRFYALDPATGKELWQVDFENDPSIAMDPVFDEKTKMFFGADEEELFAVKLARDGSGKRSWSFKFDKDGKIGDLDHEDCYAVTQTVNSSSSTSVTFSGGQLGTSTTTSISYSATAELVLQPVFRGDHFVIFGPDGVCSVGLDGKLLWTTEWNWAGKKVTLKPTFLSSGKIVFMVKEDIQVMDEKTGKIEWKEEDDYDAAPALSPNHKFLYMIEKDEVRVYKMAG